MNEQHVIEVTSRDDGGGWHAVAIATDRGVAFKLFERAAWDYPLKTHLLRWRCNDVIVAAESDGDGDADR